MLPSLGKLSSKTWEVYLGSALCYLLDSNSTSIKVYGNVKLNSTFGGATEHHIAYVIDMSDLCIRWQDVLKENHLNLVFKNRELPLSSEDIAEFAIENLDIKPNQKIFV